MPRKVGGRDAATLGVLAFDGLRTLTSTGWEWDVLAKAVVAVSIVGLVSMWLCFAALRSRLKRG